MTLIYKEDLQVAKKRAKNRKKLLNRIFYTFYEIQIDSAYERKQTKIHRTVHLPKS